MRKSKKKKCTGDNIFYVVNTLFLILITLCVLYPLIYVISCSFSSGEALMRGAVILLPVEATLEGYEAVFSNKMVWSGYGNSLLYVVVGTVISIAVTLLASYPLSVEGLRGKKLLMRLFVFTMIFDGGLIPGYMLVKNLNLLDTMWAVILPGALSAYNVIVARSFLQQNVPRALYEAAQIDGCSEFRCFLQIVLPLSKPIIAVLALWVAVGLWNSYFTPMLYLDTESKYPLQLILRDILLMGEVNASNYGMAIDPELYMKYQYQSQILRYGVIVISSVPFMILYPFVQKYFVQGALIGSVKE